MDELAADSGHQNATRQLDRGMRALSLDIHYAAPGLFGGVHNEDGPTRGNIEPYLCHQVCVLGSLKATTGFNLIAGFLRDNPNEVIVVYIEDYVSPEDLARALQATNLWQYVNDGPLTRTRGIVFPSVVRLRVPASGLARRTISVRAGRAAALGPLLLTATAGRTTTAVRMMVTAAGPLRPPVTG